MIINNSQTQCMRALGLRYKNHHFLQYYTCKNYNILHYRKQFSNRNQLPNPYDFYSAFFGQFKKSNNSDWAVARCCFHSPDRHPSLSINLRNGSFRCWACGTKGRNLIEFYMQLHCIDPTAAMQMLNERWRMFR